MNTIAWHSANNVFQIGFDGVSPANAKAAFSEVTLHVDGTELAFSDALPLTSLLQWPFDPDQDWTDGRVVALQLTVQPPPPPPPAPTGLKKYIRDTSVFLRWDYSPSDDVDKHQISQRERGDSGWGDWSAWKDVMVNGYMEAIDQYEVSGLTNGTRYEFRIRAVGPGGNSKAAKVVATPSDKPAKPEGLRANSGDGLVVLDWDYHYNEDVVTDYQYRMKEGTSDWKRWKKIPDSHEATVSHTVAGLTNGTEYGFQVRARSDAGRSRPSPASSATPEALPGKPQGVTVPQSWEMIPRDYLGNPAVGPGESFRLMFVTGFDTKATSSHISNYNEHVQLEAQRDHNYRPFKDKFRAIISTAAVHARDNVAAEGDDVPVYWNGGGFVADSTAGLFDGRWYGTTPLYTRGGAIPDDQKADASEVWTGSTSLGYAWNIGGRSDLRYYAGADRVMVGNPYKSGQELRSDHRAAAGAFKKLYAISPVITVSETDIYGATLSGNMQDGEVGCHNSASGYVRCSDETYLHDDDFTYNGVTYNVIGLRRMSARAAGLGGSIYIDFDDPDGGVKAALEGLTLNVAGYKLPFSRASENTETPQGDEPYTRLTWGFHPHPNAAWREYQDIAVSITRTTKPERPTGLAAAQAGSREVTLNWHHMDDTITKRQYRQRAGAGAWGAWTDIPDSGAGQRNRTSYTVTGLNAGVTYAFQILAVNALGISLQSDEAKATAVLLAPAKPTGLAAVAGNAQAALSWDDPENPDITKRQYRLQKVDGDSRTAWGDWTDIPNSAHGQANALSYTVTGLDNQESYRFRLRAANAAGSSPETDQVWATLVGPQTTIWSATLAVDVAGILRGCDNVSPSLDPCSNAAVLTDDDFTYGNATYTITRLRQSLGDLVSEQWFGLTFDGLTPAQAKSALVGLILVVDGQKRAFNSFSAGGTLYFGIEDFGRWSRGQKVSVSITGPAP